MHTVPNRDRVRPQTGVESGSFLQDELATSRYSVGSVEQVTPCLLHAAGCVDAGGVHAYFALKRDDERDAEAVSNPLGQVGLVADALHMHKGDLTASEVLHEPLLAQPCLLHQHSSPKSLARAGAHRVPEHFDALHGIRGREVAWPAVGQDERSGAGLCKLLGEAKGELFHAALVRVKGARNQQHGASGGVARHLPDSSGHRRLPWRDSLA